MGKNLDTRIVKVKHTYIDSEGEYRTNFQGNARVNGGTSSYVLLDDDSNKFLQRKPGALSYLTNLGMTILVGMVGGGNYPIKPSNTGKVIELIQ